MEPHRSLPTCFTRLTCCSEQLSNIAIVVVHSPSHLEDDDDPYGGWVVFRLHWKLYPSVVLESSLVVLESSLPLLQYAPEFSVCVFFTCYDWLFISVTAVAALLLLLPLQYGGYYCIVSLLLAHPLDFPIKSHKK